MSLAIAACAWLLVVALHLQAHTGAEKVPNPDYGKSSDTVSLPYLMAHYYRPPTATEMGLSVALMVVALAGVSVLASRISPRHRIVSGVVAAAVSAALGLVLLTMLARQLPPLQTIGLGIVGSVVVGAAAAWLSGRWWPNKSLERTRVR